MLSVRDPLTPPGGHIHPVCMVISPARSYMTCTLDHGTFYLGFLCIFFGAVKAALTLVCSYRIVLFEVDKTKLWCEKRANAPATLHTVPAQERSIPDTLGAVPENRGKSMAGAGISACKNSSYCM